MKKKCEFWIGGQCVAWRGYKGSLLGRKALVFVSVRPVMSPVLSPFCTALRLFTGADTVIKVALFFTVSGIHVMC